MKKQDHDEWFSSSKASNIKDSTHNSRVSHNIDRTHSLYAFHLMASSCQILLGVAVITISILGLIEPLWLSTGLIMIGSITTMIGLYHLYITVARTRNNNSLIRNAMRRVMESTN